MSNQGVLQKDGTRCRKGINCKRHGWRTQGTTWKEAKSTVPRPKDLSSYYDEGLDDLTEYAAHCGFKGKMKPPYWSDSAVTYGLGEIECDNETSLIVGASGLYSAPRLSRLPLEIWLVKNGEPVGVLRIFAQRTDEPVTEMTQETTITCVEVKPEHRGKGYAMEMVRLTEKHLINSTIHSGGHYTPEGAAALKGKLPYTKQALAEKDYGGLGIGVHFRTMSFIESWNDFFLKL